MACRSSTELLDGAGNFLHFLHIWLGNVMKAFVMANASAVPKLARPDDAFAYLSTAASWRIRQWRSQVANGTPTFSINDIRYDEPTDAEPLPTQRRVFPFRQALLELATALAQPPCSRNVELSSRNGELK